MKKILKHDYLYYLCVTTMGMLVDIGKTQIQLFEFCTQHSPNWGFSILWCPNSLGHLLWKNWPTLTTTFHPILCHLGISRYVLGPESCLRN